MRTPLPPLAVVLAFIDRINHTDLDGLLALMTDDHVLEVLDTPPVAGKETLREAWQGYYTAFPDYVIYPHAFSASGNRVAFVGHTTGSHLGLPDDQEATIPVLWTAEIAEGLVSRWSIVQDTPETRRQLSLPLGN